MKKIQILGMGCQKCNRLQELSEQAANELGIEYTVEKVKDMNRFLDEHEDLTDKKVIDRLKDDRRRLFMAARVLGILNEDPETFFARLSDSADSIDTHDVERLIEERAKARANKDWKQADAVRDQLKEMGVVLEDGPEGTTWRFDV